MRATQFDSADAMRTALREACDRFIAALDAAAGFWDDGVLAAEAPEYFEERRAEVAEFLSAPENQGKHWPLRTALAGLPWTPRDVAVHEYVGESFTFRYPLDEVTRASKGLPGRSRRAYRADNAERGDVDADYEERRQSAIAEFATAADAAKSLTALWRAQDDEIAALTDEDLRLNVRPDGMSAGDALALAVGHLTEHAQQLENAADEQRSR